MALDDILARIAAEAENESDEIIAAARERGRETRERSDVRAKDEAARLTRDLVRRAEDEAATILASERLAARDRALARKKALAEGVLSRVRERLEALPAERYTNLIARGLAGAVVPGQTLRIAAAEGTRLGGLAPALARDGVTVTVSDDPAPIERGVLVEGGGVRVEVSPAQLIADRRDELLALAAQVLFGETEA